MYEMRLKRFPRILESAWKQEKRGFRWESHQRGKFETLDARC